MTTLPEHTLCPACGAMACPHFTAELRDLRERTGAAPRPLEPPERQAAGDLAVLLRRLANLERRWRRLHPNTDDLLDELEASVRDLALTTPTKKKGPDHV